MKDYKGIYPALLTPFNTSGKINHNVLAEHTKQLISKGVRGFYVGGSTAEAFLLSLEEREEIFKTVKEAANKEVVLIAQVGAISTDFSIRLAKAAQNLGYDMISSVLPFYYKFSSGEILQYYKDIVSKTDLPMIIYNIPALAGVSLSLDDYSKFFADERFIGTKYTSGDMYLLEKIRRTYQNKIIFNGFDEIYLSALAMGADGAIGSTFNFMPEKFIKIDRLFCEGKFDEALKEQHNINTIIDALIKVGVIAGEKEVLKHMGLDFGNARPPFSPLTLEQKKFIEQTILPLL